MKKNLILGIFIVLILSLIFVDCQKITQENIDRELSRWWVIYYKMLEDGGSGQPDLITGPGGVEETLKREFNPKGEHFSEHYNSSSIKDKYRLVKRRNELMEEALISLKGEKALRKIEGIWSLDEIPELWEKVNKQQGE